MIFHQAASLLIHCKDLFWSSVAVADYGPMARRTRQPLNCNQQQPTRTITNPSTIPIERHHFFWLLEKPSPKNTPSLAPSRMLPPNYPPALNDNQQQEEIPRPNQPEDLIPLAA
jgi:hypothetical protein